jgi:adenylosuccinate synthase
VQGATESVLTILDALGYLDEIKMCTEYEIDGKRTRDFPNPAKLDRATAVYETVPGWKCDIKAIRSFDKLPESARAYVKRVEELIETPVSWVSVGPGRDAMISTK